MREFPNGTTNLGSVLIVGGAGAFGFRLAERLAAGSTAIILAGRSEARLEDAARSLRGRFPLVDVRTRVLDRNLADTNALKSTGAAIVVDAAGPFQGTEPVLAAATIAAGLHYIDLADARDYIAQFSRLDENARAGNVLAVTGASSTPALTQAALDTITSGWRSIDTIEIAIMPGNRAPRGLSVTQAILSYVGKPIRILDNGVWRERPGWSLLHRKNVNSLGRRWLALCETPDLDIAPQRFPSVQTARFFAGLELSILHIGLWCLGLLVRGRLVPSLAPAAPIMVAIARWFERFGSDRGGMTVEATGANTEGQPVRAQWTLIAESGDGPYVPVLPAVALVRKILSGAEVPKGAMACTGLLDLNDVTAEFGSLGLRAYSETEPRVSLFASVLGPTLERLPSPVRTFHATSDRCVYSGIADIDDASNALGRFIARLFRFPKPGSSQPITVTKLPRGVGELWRREFGTTAFMSTLTPGRQVLRLVERFGAISFDLAVSIDEVGLDLDVVGWRIGPIPLPRAFMPWTRATERADSAGRFLFDVTIGIPFVGRIIRYRGTLTQSATPMPSNNPILKSRAANPLREGK